MPHLSRRIKRFGFSGSGRRKYDNIIKEFLRKFKEV
jgi:hypothetical protein